MPRPAAWAGVRTSAPRPGDRWTLMETHGVDLGAGRRVSFLWVSFGGGWGGFGGAVSWAGDMTLEVSLSLGGP